MRPEVFGRANDALHELAAHLGRDVVTSTDIAVEARYDEFNLDLDVTWDGKPVDLSEEPPSVDSLTTKQEAFRKLSGFLIRHYSDRVTTERHGGHCRVLLHFDH